MNFTTPTKILATLAAVSFFVGFCGLFFNEIKAEVSETQSLTFNQQGYPGIPTRSSGGYDDSFKGSQLSLAIGKYRYTVNSKVYTGIGLLNEFDGRETIVRYPAIFPIVSISSSMAYFILAFFFAFLAIGIRSIVVWARKMVYKK